MRSTTPILAALLLLAAPALSHAQLITWLGASNITGDSDVFTTGTYVDAFQAATGGFNGKPDANQTVNGVVFHINDTYTFSDGTFSLSSAGGWVTEPMVGIPMLEAPPTRTSSPIAPTAEATSP